MNMTKGGLVLCSVPFLTSCSGITRNSIDNNRYSHELSEPLGQDKLEILRLASLAPNGHNTQPWTVTIVEPNRWIIGTDAARWLPAVDPENREMLLSIGAFLENLVLAAESVGYTAGITIVANTPKDKNIMEITLAKSTPKRLPLERITTRRTIKNNFLAKEISSEDIAFMSDGNPDQRFHYFPATSQQGKYLAEGTLEANRIQAEREPAQEELADWIRWSNNEVKKHKDGLTPASMEITGFAGWYVRTFYNRNDVLSKSFKEATIKQVTKQVNTCSGWIVITSEDSSIPTLLETGRVFQRMFLKVRERMIAIHPMTQMLEEAPFQSQIAQELGLNDTPQFILRTGYLTSYPEPVSLRRPVAWFTQV